MPEHVKEYDFDISTDSDADALATALRTRPIGDEIKRVNSAGRSSDHSVCCKQRCKAFIDHRR